MDIALLLEHLRDALLARGGLVGVYLYGSLVTGDFSPARSDIDVLVLLEREPDEGAISELRELHTTLASADDPAGRLHCLYASAQDAADPARPRRLAQAQVMPGAQGAGEQRRQGGGYSGLAQRQRRGKSALAA